MLLASVDLVSTKTECHRFGLEKLAHQLQCQTEYVLIQIDARNLWYYVQKMFIFNSRLSTNIDAEDAGSEQYPLKFIRFTNRGSIGERSHHQIKVLHD
jgi:hypothetical protein